MPTKEQVKKKLEQVIDPNTGESVYDAGLISELEVKRGKVSLSFTPSHFCPLSMHFASQIKRALRRMRGIKEVDVKIVRGRKKNSII